MNIYTLDLTFTVESEEEFEDLTQREVCQAILARYFSLVDCWEKDAIRLVDIEEIEEPVSGVGEAVAHKIIKDD